MTVQSEIPDKENPNTLKALMNKLFSLSDLEYSRIKSSVIKSGSTTAPTARSESAKPQSKTIDDT